MLRKYALATIILLAALLLVAHLYRDAIARGVANSYLSGPDLVVADVSIDTIGTSQIEFSAIFLERRDGTRIRIFDVSLPYDVEEEESVNTIEIGSIEILPGAGDSAPESPAALFQQLVDAPNRIPSKQLHVGRLQYAGDFVLEDIRWASAASSQSLHLLVRGITVEALLVDNVATQSISIRASKEQWADAFDFELIAKPSENSIDLEGRFSLQLAFLLANMRSFGVAPTNLIDLEAEISGPIKLSLSRIGANETEITAEPGLDTDLTASYQTASADQLIVVAHELNSIQVQLNYPSLEWRTQVADGDLTLSNTRFKDVPVNVSAVSCRNGIFCTLSASLSTGEFKTGRWTLEDVNATVSLTIDISSATTIEISAGTEVSGRLISDTWVSIEQALLRLPAPLTIMATADSWSARAGEISLLLKEVAIGNALHASLPVRLDSLAVSDNGGTFAANLEIPAGPEAWRVGDMVPTPIGLSGSISGNNGEIAADFHMLFGDGSPLATLEARHIPATGIGTLTVSRSEHYFSDRPLSHYLLEWPYDLDIVAGMSTLSANLSWSTDDAGFAYKGSVAYSASKLDGHFGDSAFTGLSTNVEVRLDDQDGATILPAIVKVRLVDIGVPIENLSAAIIADMQDNVIHFDDVSMSAFGGQLVTDPFTFMIKEQATSVVLRPRSVQLQFIVNLADFDSIEMTGSMSGFLPVSVSGNRIVIDGGKLESDEPGGSIRYIPPAGDAVSTGDSQLRLVNSALSNFQFESLVSDVSYSENGDLVLKMTMKGVNPDLDPTQPVILNLAVENNIPQLLRSLQATRSIEDILDSRPKN